jgi:hypothetical protein
LIGALDNIPHLVANEKQNNNMYAFRKFLSETAHENVMTGLQGGVIISTTGDLV